jgi:CBS domain-containing protein
MRVVELMSPRVVSVGPKTPLYEVLQLMLRYHLNDILILARQKKSWVESGSGSLPSE